MPQSNKILLGDYSQKINALLFAPGTVRENSGLLARAEQLLYKYTGAVCLQCVTLGSQRISVGN
jgi:hypothetical protein